MARKEHRADGTHEAVLSEIYAQYVHFVWRNLRRMGVQESSVEDAVQDVFLVVHRRLPEFQGRSQIRTWLFGIVLRVAQSHRRSVRRREAHVVQGQPVEIDAVSATDPEGPMEAIAQRQAHALVHRILDAMDDDKRAIFVLVELEQMTVREAAGVLGINFNTAYSRLRVARATFEAAVGELARNDARKVASLVQDDAYNEKTSNSRSRS